MIGGGLGALTASICIGFALVRGGLRILEATRQHRVNVELGRLEIANAALDHFWSEKTTSGRLITLDTEDCIEARLLTIDEALAQVISESSSLELVLDELTEAGKQTQLSSINAMVMAAKLGTEGQGFGLVAEESLRIATTGVDICSRSQPIVAQIHAGAIRLSDQIAGHIQALHKPRTADAPQIAELAATIAQTLRSVEQRLQFAIQSDERIRGRLQMLNTTLDSTISAAHRLQQLCTEELKA